MTIDVVDLRSEEMVVQSATRQVMTRGANLKSPLGQ